MRSPDAIVIGAGIVGAACAAELAAQGLSVTVLERGGIGGGATAAGMGHLVVMNDSPGELALSKYSLDLWLALAPQLDARDAFVNTGTLWVAADEEELAAARGMQAALASAGVRGALLDSRALREAEPALREDCAGALHIEHDSIVYAPCVAARLLRVAQGPPGAPGRIDLRLGTQVESLDAAGVRLSNGEHIAAGAVVVANGMGASSLLPGLPLEPKKGHLLITDRYPGLVHHQLLELGYIASAHQATGASVAFNVQPRSTGQLLIGSSRQFGATDDAVEPAVLARMMRRAAQYLPGLPELRAVRAWTGLRTATPDGLPLIGPASRIASVGPSQTRLWLAVGHEGLGVTTSLATAKLLAAQMLDRQLPIPGEPYLPSRFSADMAASPTRRDAPEIGHGI
jgi:glycine/D-amino acid oxidase-like deaminating enzyme